MLFVYSLVGLFELEACSIQLGVIQPSLIEKIESAEFALIGDAREVFLELQPSQSGRRALINVKEWVKGEGPGQVYMYGFGFGPDCKSKIPNRTSIFFAKKLSKTVYELFYNGAFSAVVPFTKESSEKLSNLHSIRNAE